MKLGDITSIKPEKQSIKFTNNTDLNLIGTVQLQVTIHCVVPTLYFHVTILELPYIILGLDGLNIIYPGWSFENKEVDPDVKENSLFRNDSINENTSNLSKLIESCRTDFTDLLVQNQVLMKFIASGLQDLSLQSSEITKTLRKLSSRDQTLDHSSYSTSSTYESTKEHEVITVKSTTIENDQTNQEIRRIKKKTKASTTVEETRDASASSMIEKWPRYRRSLSMQKRCKTFTCFTFSWLQDSYFQLDSFHVWDEESNLCFPVLQYFLSFSQ